MCIAQVSCVSCGKTFNTFFREFIEKVVGQDISEEAYFYLKIKSTSWWSCLLHKCPVFSVVKHLHNLYRIFQKRIFREFIEKVVGQDISEEACFAN